MADEDRSDKFTTQDGDVQFLSEEQINELRTKDDPFGEGDSMELENYEGDDELSLDEIDEDDLEEPEDE